MKRIVVTVLCVVSMCMVGCKKKSASQSNEVRMTDAEFDNEMRNLEQISKRADDYAKGKRTWASGRHLDLKCSVESKTQYDVESDKEIITCIKYSFTHNGQDEKVDIVDYPEIGVIQALGEEERVNVSCYIHANYKKTKYSIDDFGNWVTSAKVSIYNQYDELIKNGRVCLSIWTNDWTFAGIRDYKKLPDNVDLADMVYALSKPGQKIKIMIVGRDGETVFDATLKSDERLKKIKFIEKRILAEDAKRIEDEKRDREFREAKERAIAEEYERKKPERDAEKERQRRLAKLEKKKTDLERMIVVSEKNGYKSALKKYKADLEKVLEDIEAEKSKTTAQLLLEKYGASTK